MKNLLLCLTLLAPSFALAENRNEPIECLAKNIYFEAGNQSELGMKAVAYVTLNRVFDDRYPDTVCDVVYQAHLNSNGQPKRHQCQFSWYCDGKSDKVRSRELFMTAVLVASEVMDDYRKQHDYDPTGGATMYHAFYVKPNWARHYKRTVRIDSHIFYK